MWCDHVKIQDAYKCKYKNPMETKVEILKKVEDDKCKTKLAADYGV